MILQLHRYRLFSDCTIGKLSIDGVFFCHTLEDTVRPTGQKVAGKTAIPSGKYSVIVSPSVRFKKDLPLLQNVKGFDGIRIHGGNTDADTSGCILVGFAVDLTNHKIYRSAASKLTQRLKECTSTHSITITEAK